MATKTVEKREINEHDKELLAASCFNKLFPLKFEGKFTYNEVKCVCPQCGKPIPMDDTFGTLTPVTNDMHQMEARAVCKECKLMVPLSYRLYSDGRMVGLRNGRWTTVYADRKDSLFKKALKFLF